MKIKKYIWLLVSIPFLSSCTKKFLDVDNTQQLYRETYVKDLATMQEYVKGVYYNLAYTIQRYEDQTAYSELTADNVRPYSSTSFSASLPYYNWALTSIGAPHLATLWTNSYLTIRMCNFIMEETDNYRGENPEKADDIKAQALALRALLHFKLVNIFAQHYSFSADASHPGVPYITTSDITKPYARQSTAEVYELMIKDLTTSISLFTSELSDTRYMSRQAAKALLARVYLFKEDFANAQKLATEVATEVPLMTIAAGYPDNVFKLRTPASTESLFQLVPHSSFSFLSWYFRRTPIAYVATNDVAGILAEKSSDVRKNWIKDSVVLGVTYRLIKKYPIGSATEASPAVTTLENSYYPAVLRSSEMYLIVAEAASKTNDEGTAQVYLNAIRKRADPSVANITATGNALLDSIYKERRKELAFEGLRMYDLQRWKKGVSRIDVLSGAPASLPYPNNKAIAPILDYEVRISGIPQNLDY